MSQFLLWKIWLHRIVQREAAQRIYIVGPTGSGKTTLGKNLSGQFNTVHRQLDELYFNANWTPKPEAEFMSNLTGVISRDCWIIEGNYQQIQHLITERATAILWLNFSFRANFLQLLKRTLDRSWTQEEIYNGNRESFRRTFFSQDSILLWLCKTYFPLRKHYRKIFQEHAHSSGTTMIELRHPHQTQTSTTTRF